MRVGALAIALSLLACGARATGPEAPDEVDAGPSGLPCDVEGVLRARCHECHTQPPRNGAPVPLLTHADLTARSPGEPSRKVYEVALDYVRAKANGMPPAPRAPVSPGERAVLEAWVDAGTPRVACSAGGG